MPHISIKAEKLFRLGGFPVTNSLFTAVLVTVLFFFVAFYYKSELNKKADDRGGVFYFLHFIVNWIYDLYKSAMGSNIKYFFPLLGSIFFFIALNSWAGLIPGAGTVMIDVEHHGKIHEIPLLRAATADLNTTIALAIFVVVLIQYYGIKALGSLDYLGKFFNFGSVIDFFVGIMELLSEISKIISFSFRLFGNIFAGEVLITLIAFLVPVLLSGIFVGFEYFVGFMQAIVFSMLTAVFLNLSMVKHH
jgi:F-type H+-transporting ATPase subunit a